MWQNLDINLIWIALLPLAALSGWLLARRTHSVKKPNPKKLVETLNRDYIKGLNYLVNDETDRALQVFLRLIEVDNDTIETHLALGSLFRRRGEVDRALRIHQNLTARPNLSDNVRQQALLELARDYIAAGVMDRAEEILQDLVEQDAYLSISLNYLLDIYEQQKDWQEAIDAAQKLRQIGERGMSNRIAHYYCELGDIALRSGDTKTAKIEFKRAIANSESNPRASIALGQAAVANSEYKQALKIFRKIILDTPAFTPEVLDLIIECYLAQDDVDGLADELRNITYRYDGVAPSLLLLAIAESQSDSASIDHAVERYMGNKPTVQGLGKLFQALSEDRKLEDIREQLRLLRAKLGDTMSQLPSFQCQQCGFEAKHVHWRCPSCKSWGEVTPLPHRYLGKPVDLIAGSRFKPADNVISIKDR